MKLLVIGETGRTGRLIVEQALARGHEVVALVRDPSALPSRPGLVVRISRANVARFMLDCVENGTQIGGTPVVSDR